MATFDRTKIKAVLQPVVANAYQAEVSDGDLRANTLDVFSASLESTLKDISFAEWVEQEKKRQIQKTLQNQIGELHQKILGTLDGVEDLGVGGLVDICCRRKHLVAEIKNKHNTTKGNHKPNIYDDLEKMLADNSDIQTAYYVEILPKNGKSYNAPFTPSDNKTKKQRPKNECIRRIDGQSFYTLLTDNPNALRELYLLLPEIAGEILHEQFGVQRDTIKFLNEAEFDFIYGTKSG